jgi:hypothetical protein
VKFLLDTDTCIYALKQQRGVLERLLTHSPADIAVSMITEAELRTGAGRRGQRPRPAERLACEGNARVAGPSGNVGAAIGEGAAVVAQLHTFLSAPGSAAAVP